MYFTFKDLKVCKHVLRALLNNPFNATSQEQLDEYERLLRDVAQDYTSIHYERERAAEKAAKAQAEDTANAADTADKDDEIPF